MIDCEQCPDSSCCKDVTVEIDEPDTVEDWDEIRWMVSHKNVSVYKDNEDEKWVKVKGFKNNKEALKIYKKSIERFNKAK